MPGRWSTARVTATSPRASVSMGKTMAPACSGMKRSCRPAPGQRPVRHSAPRRLQAEDGSSRSSDQGQTEIASWGGRRHRGAHSKMVRCDAGTLGIELSPQPQKANPKSSRSHRAAGRRGPESPCLPHCQRRPGSAVKLHPCRAAETNGSRLVPANTSPATKKARPRSSSTACSRPSARGRQGGRRHARNAGQQGRQDGGGTAFADLVWKPVVLIEMKKRGEDLTRTTTARPSTTGRAWCPAARATSCCATSTSSRSTTSRRKWTSPRTPSTLEELPDRYGPLNFLFPTPNAPSSATTTRPSPATRPTSSPCASTSSIARSVDRETAQKFILQMLVALFAEDIGLLDKYFVTNLLEDCKSPAESYDLLGGLFKQMKSPRLSAAGGSRACRTSTAACSPRPPASNSASPSDRIWLSGVS